MKTDRELLELAAKAAGIKYHSYVEHELIGRGINIGDLDSPIWNPLDEDGAALRLAVALKADISIGGNVKVVASAYRNGVDDSDDIYRAKFVQAGNDANAVRRAIVEAAAEIGEQMP